MPTDFRIQKSVHLLLKAKASIAIRITWNKHVTTPFQLYWMMIATFVTHKGVAFPLQRGNKSFIKNHNKKKLKFGIAKIAFKLTIPPGATAS